MFSASGRGEYARWREARRIAVGMDGLVASGQGSEPCETASLVSGGVVAFMGVEGSEKEGHLGVRMSEGREKVEAVTVSSEASRLCWRDRGPSIPRS